MDLLQSADLVRTLYDFVGRDGIKITMATEQVRDAKYDFQTLGFSRGLYLNLVYKYVRTYMHNIFAVSLTFYRFLIFKLKGISL